ncbi:Type IV secretory pathway, VirD4 component, TraG/TraD family ATPase [Mariprofundus aestuarium]|uniref:Type IV secretory pathway, VirD4 component, TraG/TraD family ATPase n=1 Tax=Mariprofundus aestuarium TaxID=1921086 RepID=A0A2K8L361_MARES|nr:type IV secretion system DNA-binding domain-containing protein [Mariprofundus aestuarium]ATX80659.1 Type IV secretory pathway, VirD4 component, TraG/TraD family ATPase [Mariprofundus aestuarium]
MNDPELKLRRYINIRNNHLPKIFILVFSLVTVAAFYLLWNEAVFYSIGKHLHFFELIISGKKTFSDYLQILKSKELVHPMLVNITIASLLGLMTGIFSIMPWGKRPDRMTWLYIKDGVHVFEKARDGVKALKQKVGIWKKRGIKVYQGKGGSFRLPYELESKGFLYLGSIGSGKTASMLHAIQSIVERGDKAVIYDYKGDMTQWLAGRDDASLIAFADSRSEAWHIAKDIHNPLLARELAQTIIKETSEPVWGDNARDVLSGALEYLIATKPNQWGFQDVSELLYQDRQAIAKKLKTIGHGAANTIDKPKDDKGANSVMSTVRSGAWIFDILAKAWGNPSSGFSVREWLKDENPDKRIIILRNYPEISAVSNWLLCIIFNQLFGEVLSLKDSKERRIWAIIDELATLPKIPRFEECLVASRSKGFRFMCGIQNFCSMRERYGANIAQTIFSQFSTRIICRVTDADTASSLANDMGGDRRVVRADIKRAKVVSDDGSTTQDWSVVWNERVEPTMMNSSIMNLPDPTEVGRVPAWLYISGFPIAKLEWSFLDIKATASIDEPVEWLNEAAAIQREMEQEIEARAFKAKPFPKQGKLSNPVSEVDEFENLDDIDDFPELDGDS